MFSIRLLFYPLAFTCTSVSAVTVRSNSSNFPLRNLLRGRGVHRQTFTGHSVGKVGHVRQSPGESAGINLTWLEKHEGLMTIYTDPYDQQSILMDFTDVLDRQAPMKVLASATYREGTFLEEEGQRTVYHDPVADDTMLEFALSGDMNLVDVVRPRLSYRTSDEQAKTALAEGTWPGWAGSLKRVLAAGAEERILVDATNLIAQGFFASGWSFEEMIVDYRIREVRCFPSNIEVTVAMQILDDDGLSKVPIVVSFTMLKLPMVPMTPRRGDDRLGYFTVDFVDLGEHENRPHHLLSDEVDVQNSWIMRFNLTSPHNNGVIRFYVDPTVPERWRPYFKNGVEAWNAAFKEIGHPDAVKAILPGSDEWPKDYDPNDARFSTISWSLDPSEVYALGLAKVDPRSGEIVKSDIIVTAGWVHSWLEELDLEAPTVTHQSRGYRREARHLRNRKLQAEGKASNEAHGANGKRNPFLRNRARLHSNAEQRSAEQAFQFSPMAFAAANAKISEAEWEHTIGLGLGAVVMHETGHSLGARHNFKASTAITAQCLSTAQCTKNQGLSASIMDYTPINIFAFKELKDGEERPDLFQTTIGAYDKLLISYGYGNWSWMEGKAILEKAADYPMCTDEDRIYGDDPYCQVHELGANPLVYYRERLRLLGLEMNHLLNLSVASGESYTHYGRAVLSTINKALYIGEMASTYLGGISTVHMHRNIDNTHRNQSAATVIPDDMQLDALNMIIDIFKGKVMDLLPDDKASRYLLAREGDIGTGTVDIKLEKQALQRDMVQVLTDSEVIARLYASESYGQTTFGIEKLLDQLSDAVWGTSGDFLSDSSSWDMQATFIGQLKSMYVSHCSKFVPPSVLSRVFLRLQTCKDHVENHHQTLLRTKGEGEKNSATAAYLTYLKSILSDIDQPCSGARTDTDTMDGLNLLKKTLSD